MVGPNYTGTPNNGYATVYFDNNYNDQSISCLGSTDGVTVFYRIVIDKGVNPDYTYLLNIDVKKLVSFIYMAGVIRLKAQIHPILLTIMPLVY